MRKDDTDYTVYTIAFRDGKFLMVWNRKRKGWEMPGGHIRVKESDTEAAKREFLEEAGYAVDVIDIRDIGSCMVCAAFLGDKYDMGCEMKSEMFDSLPEELSFPRKEYEETVPWARRTLYGCTKSE